MWIKLTVNTGQPLYVRPEYIQALAARSNGDTEIYTTTDSPFVVRESVDYIFDVTKKLKELTTP